MNHTKCLSESDLTLCHYGELPEDGPEFRHLTTCADCRHRLDELRADLARLPRLTLEVDDACATRLAARVGERLQRRRANWLPVFGGALTTAAALVIAALVWLPTPPQPSPNIQVVTSPAGPPDIDLLEDMEILEDLDLLRQIEGV